MINWKNKGEGRMNGLADFHTGSGWGTMMRSGLRGMMEPGLGRMMTLGSVGLMNMHLCWLTYLPFHLEMVYIP